MAKPSKTLFISDLHLDPDQPDITARFLALLESLDAQIDALYILGDFFEVWIGDDDTNIFHQQIISALKKVTARGIPIYFMRGNRDFLIGKVFADATGCQLLADEEKISLYGTPVLLMHGDVLCTQDLKYLKARRRAKNKYVQYLFLCLPLFLRRHIAAKMRMKSYQHTQNVPAEIMDVTQSEVEKIMQKYQVHYLIHGHTHRPNIHEFMLADKPAKRLVLGAWHKPAEILVWYANGEYAIWLV